MRLTNCSSCFLVSQSRDFPVRSSTVQQYGSEHPHRLLQCTGRKHAFVATFGIGPECINTWLLRKTFSIVKYSEEVLLVLIPGPDAYCEMVADTATSFDWGGVSVGDMLKYTLDF
jgi:hypothetical protein